MRALCRTGLFAIAFAAAPGRAEGPAARAQASVEPLRLELSKPVELICRTKSVVVKTNAANATTGELRLGLLLKDAAGKGAWRVAWVSGEHVGSLGHREGKSCAEACPLTIAADGNLELWSPAPKGVDKLADGEMLLLAVVKSNSLDLRATTFSGKEIESLEEGTCGRAP